MAKDQDPPKRCRCCRADVNPLRDVQLPHFVLPGLLPLSQLFGSDLVGQYFSWTDPDGHTRLLRRPPKPKYRSSKTDIATVVAMLQWLDVTASLHEERLRALTGFGVLWMAVVSALVVVLLLR